MRAQAVLAGLAPVLALSALGTGHSGAQPPHPARTEVAIFAGGCFWSTEKLFEETPGVIEAVSGYTGGSVPQPTYEQVVRGRTGHREAVRVTFDPARVSYAQLVERFWRSIDPADAGGVICDRGFQYTTALFVA
ncbi:MAG: peptide-methionine (S)-S-oxide reductase MsrA, partial [Sphingomonadaceae bacterium]